LLCLIAVSVGQYYLGTSEITNGLLSPYIWIYMWALVIAVPLAVFIIVNLLIYRWLIKSWKF